MSERRERPLFAIDREEDGAPPITMGDISIDRLGSFTPVGNTQATWSWPALEVVILSVFWNRVLAKLFP